MVDTGDPIRVVLNGERQELPRGVTVAELLRGLGHDPRAVAVEHNGEILRRSGYETTEIHEGDRLEVVRFVQGG